MKATNRHSTLFPLSHRGFNQAQRNNSHSIWTLLSWEEQLPSFQEAPKQLETTLDTTFHQEPPKPELQELQKQVPLQTANEAKADEKPEKRVARANSFVRSGAQPIQPVQVVESEFQRLKRKSIEKYLRDQVAFSRTMSNSAFRKFYQRPCPQTYGSRNTHTERGAFYGNFMKTHNVQPHTLDNHPDTYQTYASALNFGKRTKLDLQDRWKRIERQLAKNLDFRELAYMQAAGQIDLNDADKENLLKENIDHLGRREGTKYQKSLTVGLSKSAKSLGKMETRATFANSLQPDVRSSSAEKERSRSFDRPLHFIYKYEQNEGGYNCTRYARDRHGITCYVDNAFRQNDPAYLQFQKNIKPTMPEKCRPEDTNIDRIRIQNCTDSKQLPLPGHYLLPVTEQPYLAQKYARKGRGKAEESQS